MNPTFTVSLVMATSLLACGNDATSPAGAAAGCASCSNGAGASSAGGAGGATSSSGSGAGGAGGGDPTLPPCVANRFVSEGASGSGDGSQSNPWSLLQAMESAMAGDCVQVGPGVYSAPPSDERYIPAFWPRNSGTEEAPIVFFAEFAAVYNESQRSELRNDSPEVDTGSPTFGSYLASYIVWDGFYIDEANAHSTPDTGPVVVWASDHVTLQRNVIQGEPLTRQDNHCGIRFEYTSDSRVFNNVVRGFYDATDPNDPNQNYAGIMAYDAPRILVEYNDLYDNDVDLFVKGWHGDPATALASWTIRNNRLVGANSTSVHLGGVNSVSGAPRTLITHNLIIGAREGLFLHSYGETTPADIDFVNNTIVDSTRGANYLWYAGAQHDVFIGRNLIVGGPTGHEFSELAGSGLAEMKGNGLDINDNHYFDQALSLAEVGDPQGGSYGTTSAFASGTEFGNPGTGYERDGSVGDPLFVDRGGEDFHLLPGSPALTAGLGGVPVGCFAADGDVVGVIPPP
jgi:hypothetical protein